MALPLSLVTMAAPAPALALADPTQITFTLEGCNLDHGATFNAATLRCSDTGYTTGNLGKSWAELDYVPHRVTLSNGNGTQSYTFVIAGDYANGPAIGWDDITVLTFNAALSSATGCDTDPAEGTVTITDPGDGVGGADQTIYRTVDIENQVAGATCVYDYAQRLAVGAHLFNGSSLQSNLWNQALGSSGIGQKRIQLPVAEIEPQTIAKDMTATRGADHVWNVTKQASPATVTFANTCDPNGARSAAVAITVSWERLPAAPSGMVTIVTNIYATNPAHRDVIVNVSDKIYEGSTQATQVGGTASSGDVTIEANTTELVMTHTVLVSSAASSFNDVATATYKDAQFPDVAIPGQTTATASATVQTGSTSNATATITDVESISGTGLSYSVDSFSGATGAFDGGYVAGTQTTGNVSWTSATQTGTGSVTFNKTVYVTAATSTSGTLSDVATLTGSGGFTASANASSTLSASKSVTLDITKTIPNVLQGAETQTFTFDVTGPGGYVNNDIPVTFSAGETSDTVTLIGLDPGTYTVHEDTATGWAPQTDQTVTIAGTSLTSCSGGVTFNNALAPASAQVKKITQPAGSEAGWTFTLSGPGTPVGGVSVTTTGSGFIGFPFDLQEGNYTITETAQGGWDQVGSTGCSFTVSYPADAGRVFSCEMTNRQRGSITIVKETVPTSSDQAFGYTTTGSGLSAFSLDTDSGTATPHTKTFTDLVAGSYSVTETLPVAGWDFNHVNCISTLGTSTVPAANSTNATVSLTLAAGDSITCTYKNTQRGNVDLVKTFNGGAIPTGESFAFQLRKDASAAAEGTILASLSVDSTTVFPVQLNGDLVPGTYQICEFIKPGYDSTIRDMAGAFVPASAVLPSDADNAYVCAPITVAAGQTTTVTIDNQPPPGGMAKTIGFWKNWSSCSGSNGRQLPILDQTLAGHSIQVGTLPVDTCIEAVRLLNKSRVDNAKKMASDPAFNFAAQYVAFNLNLLAGANSTCTAANTAASAGQTILLAISFNGSTHTNISKANANLLNSYAATLDSYNNNTLAGC